MRNSLNNGKNRPFSVTIDKNSIHFSAAHAVVFDHYEEGLHGHNYLVEIEITGSLDNDNVVIDFIQLERIAHAVALNFDHFVLIPTNNPKIKLQENNENQEIEYGNRYYSIPKSEVKLIECINVTTEILCQKFGEILQKMLVSKGYWSRIKKLKVIIWETNFYQASFEIQPLSL